MGALDRIFRGRRGAFSQRPLAAQVAALFANNEQGLWYDVEAFRDAWNSAGPERLTNGSFDDGLTGWGVTQPAGSTISASGGNVTIVSDGASYAAITQYSVMEVGKLYVVTVEVLSITGIAKIVGVDTEVQVTGSKTFVGRATLTQIAIARQSAVNLVLGKISVKEWVGLPMCSLYQDAIGSLPAYLPGQGQADPPVGFVLDRRFGLARGAEVWDDSRFVGTGESSRISAGVYRIYSSAGAYSGVGISGYALTPGRCYEVTFNVDSIATVGGGIQVEGAISYSIQTTGFKRQIILASGTQVIIKRSSGATDFQISNVSFKPLSGNHAYQTTTASRPVLSARYNGLLASEKYNDGTYWTWQASFTSELTAETAAPDGTNTAWKITSTNANAALSKAGISGFKNPVLTVWCKSGTWNPTIMVRNATTATNLLAGTITAPDRTDTYGKFTNTDLGNGWRRLRIEITSGVALTDSIVVYVGSTGAIPVGQAMYIWRSDLREAGDGVGLPEYQRVVDANNYDTAGFPLYLKFDGVDDGLQTGAVDLSAADKLLLSAAIRRLSDSGLGVVLEASSDYSASNGTFVLLAPGASGTPSVGFNAKGTALTGGLSYTTSAAPVGLLVSAYADIATSYRALRVNGAQVAFSTTSIGTGAFGNAVLYLGRRAGTSLPFNGRLYGLLLRAGAANDGQIQKVERYLNQKGRVF